MVPSTGRPKLQRLIITVLICGSGIVLANPCHSKTYHVASFGNDANLGSVDSPYRTIQRAASLMQPGDICTIHGGTYRETVVPRTSGTREQPIQFVAAKGEKVLVSGTDVVAGEWVEHQRGIIKTRIAHNKVAQVFAAGQLMLEARWPNADAKDLLGIKRGQTEPGTDYEGIVASELPSGDLLGARILLWPGREWDNTCRVVARVAGEKLIFNQDLHPEKEDTLHGFDPFKPTENNPFVLYDSLALLDSPGEWFFDEETQTLYWQPVPGIEPKDLELRVRIHGFQLNGLSNIMIQGIDLIGCGFDLRGATRCVIRECATRFSDYPTELDIYQNPDLTNIVTGSDNLLERCTFAYAALSGLTIRGVNNTITDCLIQTCNYLGAHKASLDAANSQGLSIQHCTIQGSGRELIHFKQAKRLSILYCDVSDGNRLSNDTGAMKCWGTDGEGSVIAYNWVHDNKGQNTVGIYLDNYSKNFTVHHNVVWNNSGAGIRLNSPSNDNLIYNNTVLDNGKSFAVFTYRGKIPDQSGTKVFNNVYSDELQFIEGDLAPAIYDNWLVDPDGHVPPSASNMMIEEISDSGSTGTIGTGKLVPAKRTAIGAYEIGKGFWKPGRRNL